MSIELSPFIDACRYIIEEVTGYKTEAGAPFGKSSPYKAREITILFGMVGEVSGQVTFAMDWALGHRITSAMLAQSGLQESEEFVNSAISEFGNMVMGHAANGYYKRNLKFDITPPSVISGNNLLLSVERLQIICVPIQFDDGMTMDVNICYKL